MKVARPNPWCCLVHPIHKFVCSVQADTEKVKQVIPMGVVRRTAAEVGEWTELPGTDFQVRIPVNGSPMTPQPLEFRRTPADERTASQHRPECGGRSILEMAEDELDAVFERLKSGEGQAEDGQDRGRAEGMARIIAIFRNPYAPDLDLVRAMAVERWEQAIRVAEDEAELQESPEEYAIGQQWREYQEEAASEPEV